jgi:flagellar hook-associated protein 2
MASFNFTGTISGLDTQSLMTAMLAAEKAPLTRMATQRTTLKNTSSAFGQLRSALAALQAKAKAFTADMAGAKRTAVSSSTSVLTAAASAGTVPGSYAITVGHLASSTVATSTAALGRTITGADLDTALADLPLPGSVSAGTVGITVGGRMVKATIGDPATTTLRQATDAIAAAIQTQIQANEGPGSTATVTAAINGNKVAFSLAGTATSHAISFGAGGDSSNALGVLGLAGVSAAAFSSTTPVTARSVLGVVRTTSILDSAGLAGLTSGAGTLSINGSDIAYDTTTDSLSALVTRINSSTAGVVASLDRGNDRLLLTSRAGGAAPISISDTGSLATALNLAPGTTNAQALGTQAQVTVDGRTYLSDTNKVTDAISGVTLTLYAEGSSTLTVSPDSTAVAQAVTGLISSYNSLADSLDSLTQNDPKLTRGTLAGESSVRDLALSLRRTLTGMTGLTGAYRALSDIGVTTGAAGAALGTTARLQLNESKLAAALEASPTAVADLLNSAGGALKPMVDALDLWTTTGGRIDKSLESILSTLKSLDAREEQVNARVATRTAALEKKFATLEATLAQLQTSSSATTAQITQMNKSSSG